MSQCHFLPPPTHPLRSKPFVMRLPDTPLISRTVAQRHLTRIYSDKILVKMTRPKALGEQRWLPGAFGGEGRAQREGWGSPQGLGITGEGGHSCWIELISSPEFSHGCLHSGGSRAPPKPPKRGQVQSGVGILAELRTTRYGHLVSEEMGVSSSSVPSPAAVEYGTLCHVGGGRGKDQRSGPPSSDPGCKTEVSRDRTDPGSGRTQATERAIHTTGINVTSWFSPASRSQLSAPGFA